MTTNADIWNILNKLPAALETCVPGFVLDVQIEDANWTTNRAEHTLHPLTQTRIEAQGGDAPAPFYQSISRVTLLVAVRGLGERPHQRAVVHAALRFMEANLPMPDLSVSVTLRFYDSDDGSRLDVELAR